MELILTLTVEGLVRAGLTKHIGVCNMGTAGLRDLISYAEISPAALQVELHPFNQQAQLLRYAKEQGIAVTGFRSGLGLGLGLEVWVGVGVGVAVTNPTSSPNVHPNPNPSPSRNPNQPVRRPLLR